MGGAILALAAAAQASTMDGDIHVTAFGLYDGVARCTEGIVTALRGWRLIETVSGVEVFVVEDRVL